MATNLAQVPTLFSFALDAVCQYQLDRGSLPGKLLDDLAKRMKLKFFYFHFRSQLRRTTFVQFNPHERRREENGLNWEVVAGTASREQAIYMWIRFCRTSPVPYRSFVCQAEDVITFLDDQVALGRLRKNNGKYEV